MHYKILTFLILFTIGLFESNSQSLRSDTLKGYREQALSLKNTIIPATFILYGYLGINSDYIKGIDYTVKNYFHDSGGTRIDDYIQYLPIFMVYALDVTGIKGRNNFSDKTAILATSSILTLITVRSIKAAIGRQRPDGRAFNSFPSGHTATAFMAAEFFRLEYGDISPWLGIAGYTSAALTGGMRIYNNRHWLTDVIAGAGIGIICSKVANSLIPGIKNRSFRNGNTEMTPLFRLEGEHWRLGLIYCF